MPAFSILERIDVGETSLPLSAQRLRSAFSILERIDVGETTSAGWCSVRKCDAFSILERIDVGETHDKQKFHEIEVLVLSVSSNGSTWVKPN